ncbi:MAG: DUF2249 domain-containing protein [Micrococcaceae bacterium]|nr:DUF2249 domain-containing protein [Micrococcaceae bacterium]
MADIVISSSKEEAEKQNQPAAHECACGDHDAGFPELDARVIPHAIRHATIFGALDSIAVGGGLILLAPHNPLPLLEQIENRAPGAFEISYLEEGPEDWRLQLLRKA